MMIPKFIRPFVTREALVGWAIAFHEKIWRLVELAGDVTFLATYGPKVWEFFMEDWGTWIIVAIGLTLVGHSYLRYRKNPDMQAPEPAEPPEPVAEPKPEPDERIPYLAIQDLANQHGWQIVCRSPENLDHVSQSANRAYMLEGHLRQAAVDGDLHVWGRKSSEPVANTPLVPIPSSHFEEFEFRNGPWVYPMENRDTRTGQLGIPDERLVSQSYVDLHVSKNDVQRLLDRLEAPTGLVV